MSRRIRNRATTLGRSSLIVLSVLLATPIGAGASPYQNHRSLKNRLTSLAKREPDLVRIETLARSIGKRDVWLAEVASGAEPQREHRPAVLVVAGIEGADLLGSHVAVTWIEQLVEQYGKNTNVTNLLDTTTIYVAPRLNPDAAEHYFETPRLETSVNVNPHDDDHDGLIDEDGPEDLNEDGLITQMRVRDGRGQYALDAADERLLVKADASKGESPAWRILIEGIDNDGDGKWNEDGPGGVNFNRNFPFGYEYFASDGGVHQVSESETRALADFVVDHPNIAIVVTYGAAENMLGAPESAKPPGQRRPLTAIDEADVDYYRSVGELFREALGLDDKLDNQSLPGTFSDWMYFHRGRLSLAISPWNPKVAIALFKHDEEREDDSEEEREADDDDRNQDARRQIEWFDEHAPDAFLEWQRFDHPDFPNTRVEIGGYKPFALIHPPDRMVSDLVSRHARFLTALAQKLPRIAVQEIEVRHLGQSVYEIEIAVANGGFLPTVLSHGQRSGAVHPTRLTLEIAESRILSGGRRITYLPPIAGSGGATRARYVIHQPHRNEIAFAVVSALAGRIDGTIELAKD